MLDIDISSVEMSNKDWITAINNTVKEINNMTKRQKEFEPDDDWTYGFCAASDSAISCLFKHINLVRFEKGGENND